MYLWGSHFCKDPALHAREPEYFAEATQRITDALFVSNGTSLRDHAVLFVVQAEILLAYYLFYVNRNLEGRYHASAAGALVLSCQLNLVRSDRVIANGGSEDAVFGMVPPKDSVEEGERIDAFWSVYILDKTWSTALGFPSAIPGDSAFTLKIDTPWPVEMQTYEDRAEVSGVALCVFFDTCSAL